MTELKTFCSDWSLGWGLGGHNKIGNLFLNPETLVFTWKGHAQGRHNNRLTKTYQVDFKYDEANNKLEWLGDIAGSLPVWEMLKTSIKQLLYDMANPRPKRCYHRRSVVNSKNPATVQKEIEF